VSGSQVEAAVEAIRADELVVIPTDTVYGLAATAYRERAARRLYRLKGRPESQPTALLASSLDLLLECIPELRGRAATIARALLPGPYTLVLPNPACRFRWLCGSTAEAIGIRVPELDGAGRVVLDHAGTLAATSANLPGGPEPRRLADVPEEIRTGARAVVDGGDLPGKASTVIDFTSPEPRVLRVGAADADAAIARAAAAMR
jgi:L-threonylcarbamoyladenylate synthase